MVIWNGQAETSTALSSSKKWKQPPSVEMESQKNKKGMDVAPMEYIVDVLAKVGWFRVVLDEA